MSETVGDICCAVCKSAATHCCVRCKSVYYCSKECQRIDWKSRHKQVCIEAEVVVSSPNPQQTEEKTEKSKDNSQNRKMQPQKEKDARSSSAVPGTGTSVKKQSSTEQKNSGIPIKRENTRRIQEAKEAKVNGNKAFERGDYATAVALYQEGLQLCAIRSYDNADDTVLLEAKKIDKNRNKAKKGHSDSDEDDPFTLRDRSVLFLALQLNSNLVQSYLKLEDWASVLHAADCAFHLFVPLAGDEAAKELFFKIVVRRVPALMRFGRYQMVCDMSSGTLQPMIMVTAEQRLNNATLKATATELKFPDGSTDPHPKPVVFQCYAKKDHCSLVQIGGRNQLMIPDEVNQLADAFENDTGYVIKVAELSTKATTTGKNTSNSKNNIDATTNRYGLAKVSSFKLLLPHPGGLVHYLPDHQVLVSLQPILGSFIFEWSAGQQPGRLLNSCSVIDLEPEEMVSWTSFSASNEHSIVLYPPKNDNNAQNGSLLVFRVKPAANSQQEATHAAGNGNGSTKQKKNGRGKTHQAAAGGTLERTFRWIRVKPIKGPVPVKRQSACCWLVDDDFYMFGGVATDEPEHSIMCDLWKFSLKTFQWTQLGPQCLSKENEDTTPAPFWPEPRSECLSGAVSSDKQRLYCVGGYHELNTLPVQDRYHNDGVMYEISTGNWRRLQISGLPRLARMAMFCLKIKEEDVLVACGGYNGSEIDFDSTKGGGSQKIFQIDITSDKKVKTKAETIKMNESDHERGIERIDDTFCSVFLGNMMQTSWEETESACSSRRKITAARYHAGHSEMVVNIQRDPGALDLCPIFFRKAELFKGQCDDKGRMFDWGLNQIHFHKTWKRDRDRSHLYEFVCPFDYKNQCPEMQVLSKLCPRLAPPKIAASTSSGRLPAGYVFSIRMVRETIFERKNVILGNDYVSTYSLQSFDELPENNSIERTVMCFSGLSLGAFANRILIPTMGWEPNFHSHYFTWMNTGAVLAPKGDNSVDAGSLRFRSLYCLDEDEYTLEDLFHKVGDELHFCYDLGDNWNHMVKLEKIISAEDVEQVQTVVLSGKNACPPENISSLYLDELLDAKKLQKFLKDRPNYEGFAPAHFNLEERNQALRRGLGSTGSTATKKKHLIKPNSGSVSEEVPEATLNRHAVCSYCGKPPVHDHLMKKKATGNQQTDGTTDSAASLFRKCFMCNKAQYCSLKCATADNRYHQLQEKCHSSVAAWNAIFRNENVFSIPTSPSHLDPTLETSSSLPAAVAKSPTSSPQKEKEDEQQQHCVICLAENKCMLAVPCGHKALCEPCSNTLKSKSKSNKQFKACPICRKEVQQWVKVYD